MWTKICGNTRLEDCLLAAELGASAIGFVFAPGKRTVTAAQIAPIVRELPTSLATVGVFTTTDFDEIARVVDEAGLSGVQVHTEPNLPLLQRLRGLLGPKNGALRLLQVVPWWTDVSAAAQIESFRNEVECVANDGSADAVLIDSRTRTASGGTGVVFDWNAAAMVLGESALPVIVAGGLTPANVQSAIRTLRPFGVDVSSGVESSPGVKSPELLQKYFEEIRGADSR